MRAHKYGGLGCLRNTLVRRHLFFNPKKSLSLDEMLEYTAGRCTGKWWEVHAVEVAENTFRLERRKILETPCYGVAWDKVKDEAWEKRKW